MDSVLKSPFPPLWERGVIGVTGKTVQRISYTDCSPLVTFIPYLFNSSLPFSSFEELIVLILAVREVREVF